jgi:PKD repeat protein
MQRTSRFDWLPALVASQRNSRTLDNLTDYIGSGRRADALHSACQPIAEALEERRLLSGVSKVGGTLTVTGNATSANKLVVQWSSDHKRLNIVENKLTAVKKFAGISAIVIIGGTKNDSISVTKSLTVPVTIDGNGGKDSVSAPAGAKIIEPGTSSGTTTGSPTSTGSGAGSGTGSSTTSGSSSGSGIAVKPAVEVPGKQGADVVGNVGWTPPTGGAGNMAGNSGVTTVDGHSSDSSAPQPVIDILTQTVYAGTSIQFNGNQSKLGAGDPLSALYQWNFGDSSGKYNTLMGWNAAHVYNTPGSYTVTLSVTNLDGKTTSTTAGVHVLADNRRTIYVDSSGSDRNSGYSPSSPIQSVYRAEQLAVRGNVRILFHGGETFTVNHPIGISVTHANVYIGTYDGPNATILLDGPDAGIQSFHGGGNLVINDLTFDSVYKPHGSNAPEIPATAIFPGGTNTLVENCTFLNVDYAVNAEVAPSGVMMQDNNAPDPTGLRAYIFWGQGTDDVIIGNYDANSTQQHDLRTSGVDRQLVAYNNFTNLGHLKGTIEIQKGTYAYVIGNTLADGPLRAGPRGENTEPASTVTDWTVFDANRVTSTEVEVWPGTHHMLIENNILQNNGKQDINIDPTDPEGRNISDIRIFNNTGIDTSTTGNFIYGDFGIPTGSLIVGNNLFVAPNLKPGTGGAASIYVQMKSLSGFASIFDNVWADDASRSSKWAHGGVNFVWPNYMTAAGYLTVRQWDAEPVVHNDTFSNVSLAGNLAATGPAASSDAEALAGVFTDFYGKLRPIGSNWSAGAVQA